METKGNRTRLGSIAAMALVVLAVVPLLAASASAGAVGPGASAATGKSGEWAYGGQGWSSGGFTVGKVSLTWNSSVGVDVVINATNTSANVTELTVTRTIVATVTATYTGPFTTWTYNLKAVEDDLGHANVTNAATVVLADSSKVPALGLLNASLYGNATVKASLLGSAANKTVSDYLNVSGWARAQVAFAPALGLIPLNLTGVTAWNSTANASGSAAWNVSWSYVNHGWNGTTAAKSGDFNGTWSTTTEVTLFGHLGGAYARWIDHVTRTAVALSLAGPFDLYAGVLLIPHHFDLFHGAGSAYSGAGLGTSSVSSENLYLVGGRVSARSVSAANLSTGGSTPAPPAVAGGAAVPAVDPTASSAPGATVWAGPESPSAAQSQATCLQFGCPSSSNGLGKLIGPLVVVGVVAVAAVALVVGLRSRGRGRRPTDVPLAANPAYPPAAPTVDPTGGARPPQ